jgi:hypothetical protein
MFASLSSGEELIVGAVVLLLGTIIGIRMANWWWRRKETAMKQGSADEMKEQMPL